MVKIWQPIFSGSIMRIIVTVLLLLYLTGINTVIIAQDSGICTQQLAQAEDDYNRGRFDEAIKTITDCLGKPGLGEQEKMRAYRLLGLAYLAKDYLEEARGAVKKLLDMVPNYESDPVQDPPPFTKLIEEVKQEQPAKVEEKLIEKKKPEKEKTVTPKPAAPVSEKKGGGKKWLYIGGGVLVAGGVGAAILLSGNGEEKTETSSFPLPPGRP